MIGEDEFSELVDANVPRVDLVGKAANGTTGFLLMKSGEGVMDPTEIRTLIEKAGSMDTPDLDASTTLVGTSDGTTASPTWEQVDADTASKWVAILSRAKNAVNTLADRENLEVLSGQDDDQMNVWNLQDACCAIDAAIACLAPFAAGEYAEAALSDDDLSVMKAVASLDEAVAPLSIIEGLAPIAKAGRTLSSANEGRIRDAAAALQSVLSTLPAVEGSDMSDVTKGTTDGKAVAGTSQDETDRNVYSDDRVGGLPHGDDSQNDPNRVVTPNDGPDVKVPSDVMTLDGLAGSQDDINGTDFPATEPVVDTGVQKAAGDGKMQAVYNSAGKLLGTVDPSKITLLIDEDGDDAAAPVDTDGDGADGSATDDGATDTSGATDGNDAAAVTPADMSPAKANDVGTPADDGVAKSQSTEELIKAAVAEIVAENATVVKALEDRLAYLEAPAPSKVLSAGVLPPSHLMKGQDKEGDATQVNITKAEELQKQRDAARSTVEREAIEKQMQEAAAAEFANLRATQRMAPLT